MQNAVNNQNGENVVGMTTEDVTDAIKRVHGSTEMFTKEVADNAERLSERVCIVKKDGTKEQYNVQKVVNAVKKSATRMLITFSDEELKRICDKYGLKTFNSEIKDFTDELDAQALTSELSGHELIDD